MFKKILVLTAALVGTSAFAAAPTVEIKSDLSQTKVLKLVKDITVSLPYRGKENADQDQSRVGEIASQQCEALRTQTVRELQAREYTIVIASCSKPSIFPQGLWYGVSHLSVSFY